MVPLEPSLMPKNLTNKTPKNCNNVSDNEISKLCLKLSYSTLENWPAPSTRARTYTNTDTSFFAISTRKYPGADLKFIFTWPNLANPSLKVRLSDSFLLGVLFGTVATQIQLLGPSSRQRLTILTNMEMGPFLSEIDHSRDNWQKLGRKLSLRLHTLSMIIFSLLKARLDNLPSSSVAKFLQSYASNHSAKKEKCKRGQKRRHLPEWVGIRSKI